MATATYKSKKIKIPYHPEEFTFEKAMDFKIAIEEFEKQCKVYTEQDIADFGDEVEDFVEPTVDPIEEDLMLLEAVDCIVPGVVGLVDKYNLPGENTTKLVENGYVIKPGDELSTCRIYAHIITIIDTYKPEKILKKFSVRHYADALPDGQHRKSKDKKITYYIEPDDVVRATNYKKTYSNAEVLLTNIFNRNTAKGLKRGDLVSSNLMFKLSIEEMAVLLRRKNEKLPVKRREQFEFVDRRKKVFRDLPYSTVLDVRFFFRITIAVYIVTILTAIFGKGKSKKAKTSSKRKRSTKRTPNG